MATLKICVQKQRKDGYYPVYIRVSHGGKVGYIKTDKVVNSKGLNSKTKEIKDPYVLQMLSVTVVDYIERLNKKNTSHWSLNDVMSFLKTGDEDISFSKFSRKFINEMIDAGQVRNARNYQLAVNHFERYVGSDNVNFSALTSSLIERWIKSMSSTQRAKEMYPVCLRQIFKGALLEFNDYDNGVIRIKTNPWMKVRIPKSEKPEKLAISPEQAREFFAAPLPPTKIAQPLSEIGHDVAMMVLCLAGINTVDLYNLRKKDYHNGIIHYRRAKTTKSRADDAYIEMRVPPILLPLMEKYSTPDDDDWLFSFHRRFSSSDSFGSGANTGIKQICENMGIKGDDRYCVYTFRHTWGTVAQNDCGATISEVGFAMNHSQGAAVTRGYLKVDFSPAWKLNEKVVDFIFFSDEKGKRQRQAEEAEDPTDFTRFSKKHMIKGAVFFRGKSLGQIQDIGFSNVEQVIGELSRFIPDDMPQRAILHFRIEIVDKGQTTVYERMRGVNC
ncbi:MAG: phage integrase SAM-like domain-containing protein [Muribaculaceae bacterium]|nr:phage integrase SAM-like domain-containing protein [Muribaculaceae bacterium]